MSFFTLLGLVIIAAGVVAFMRFRSEAEVYHTDLFSLVPQNSKSFIYFQDSKKLVEEESFITKLSEFLPEKKSFAIINSLQKEGVFQNMPDGNEMIFSFHPNGTLILSKLVKENFNFLNENILRRGINSFVPKTYTYKGTEVYVCPLGNGDFFCYTYHKGVFLGSYSKKLLDSAIDMYNSGTNLRDNPIFNSYVETISKNVFATFFISEKAIDQENKSPYIPFNNWFAGDISFPDDEICFSGIILSENENWLFDPFITSENNQPFNPELLPVHASTILWISPDSTFQIQENGKTKLLEAGICYIEGTDSVNYENPVIFSSIVKDTIPDINHPIHIVEYPEIAENQNIEDADTLFNRLLNTDSVFFFTSYKNYLLRCKDKATINEYIRQLEDTVIPRHDNRLKHFYKEHEDNKNGFLLLADGHSIRNCPEITSTFFLFYLKDRNEKFSNYDVLLQLQKNKEHIYYFFALKKQ